MKNLIFYIFFMYNISGLKAQQKDYDMTLFNLTVKELKQPLKYNSCNSFGSSVFCKGSLISVLNYLLGDDYGRLRIKGSVPDKYIDLNLKEPTQMGFEEMLTNGNKKKDIDELDSLSLTKIAITLLSRTYNFTVTSITDSSDIWSLQIVDISKLMRYDEVKDYDNRGAGPDFRNNAWEGIGVRLSYMCYIIASKAKSIIYDESNEKGLFNFVNPQIPYNLMENFDTINDFLKINYGLHFVKRKQLEKLKFIEFK